MTSAKTCAHAACSCALDRDELYCSRGCREAAERPVAEDRGCDCGHPGCLGEAGRQGPDELARAPDRPEDGPDASGKL